ncbi:MAG: phosphohistidine phosphatase SixA [Desulforhopalus sp.]
MAIYLIQHGVSESKEIDPNRGLSDTGRKETERIAQVAKGYAIPVSQIVHSGKKRAEQTAAIFHAALSVSSPLQSISGINPLDDVKIFGENIRPEDNTMIVGHMPFMQRLVSFLTTGSEDNRVYQFQNSGIVCLDMSVIDGERDWFIKWTLNPTIS